MGGGRWAWAKVWQLSVYCLNSGCSIAHDRSSVVVSDTVVVDL